MSTPEFPTTALADRGMVEAPLVPFKLLHIDRAPELDHQDKRAFNVWLQLNELVELGSPCLYFLTPSDARCGFALAQHAPRTHVNQLLMLLVDQDNVYEALALFEERVRTRARRMLALLEPVAPPATTPDATDYAADMALDGPSDVGEPPEWMLEPPPEAYDPANEVADYGDLY